MDIPLYWISFNQEFTQSAEGQNWLYLSSILGFGFVAWWTLLFGINIGYILNGFPTALPHTIWYIPIPSPAQWVRAWVPNASPLSLIKFHCYREPVIFIPKICPFSGTSVSFLLNWTHNRINEVNSSFPHLCSGMTDHFLARNVFPSANRVSVMRVQYQICKTILRVME